MPISLVPNLTLDFPLLVLSLGLETFGSCPYSRILSLVTGWWSLLRSPKTSNFFVMHKTSSTIGNIDLSLWGPSGYVVLRST